MQDLASLGLKLRVGTGSRKGERRIEMRLASDGSFVAWFQSNERMSNGELVRSTNTQFVRRNELNELQLSAVQAWIREELSATI